MVVCGRSRGGKKWANSGYISKVEPTILVNGLGVLVCKKKGV